MAKDYGMPTATLLDVLANDFVLGAETSGKLDAPGLLESLVEAEQAGTLDDAAYASLLRAFLRPLWPYAVDLSVPGEQPPVLTKPEFAREGDDVSLTFYQFVDESALRLLQEHAEEITAAGRVRVDLTHAREGALGNAYGLLSLAFSRPLVLAQLMGPRQVATRYTQRNAQLRLEELERMARLTDGESHEQLEREMEHVRQCAAAARENERHETWAREAEYYEPLQCPAAPEGVQVEFVVGPETADAAELVAGFVLRARQEGASNARLTGRPSGRARFSNLLRAPLGEGFSLVYPITVALPAE